MEKKSKQFAEGLLFNTRKFYVQINVLIIMACFLSSCSPFRAIDLLVDRKGYSIEKEQSYGSSPSMKLDVYFPKNQSNINEDIIMFVYGGSWRSGRLFSGKNVRLFRDFFREKMGQT